MAKPVTTHMHKSQVFKNVQDNAPLRDYVMVIVILINHISAKLTYALVALVDFFA
jgi:hypothetical protein